MSGRFVKTKGIIISSTNYDDSDKILTVLTPDLGKISCVAKGAKRSTSRLLGSTQVFSYSELVLFRGAQLYHINSSEIIESFFYLNNNLKKLSYAMYLLNFAKEVTYENQTYNRFLKLLLNTLHLICNTDRNEELLIAIFELRALCVLGYCPNVRNCSICKGQMEETYFSFKNNGLICGKCNNYDYKIQGSTVQAIKHIVTSDMKKLFSFEVSNETLKELQHINKRYIKEKLEKTFEIMMLE